MSRLLDLLDAILGSGAANALMLMSKPHIRPADPADASQIVAGITAVCAEKVYFYTAQYQPTPAWEVALHTPGVAPGHLLLAAKTGGQLAGAANLFPVASETSAGLTGELGIFVLRPFRGQGIGTTLMDAVLKSASVAGYTRILLSVLATNARAIHLYRKFGFVVERQCRREYAFLGEQDEFIMAKSLDECGSRGVGMSERYPDQQPKGQLPSDLELPFFDPERPGVRA